MQKVTQFIICAAFVFCSLIAVSEQQTSATHSTSKYSSTELADYIRYTDASAAEKAIMLSATENQVSLWKVHLSLYKQDTPGLTTVQRQIIDDTLTAFPALFVVNRNAQAQSLLLELKSRARSAFTKEEAAKAFGRLGGIGLNAATFVNCHCYTLSDFCDTGEGCRLENACENPTSTGCGWLLLEPCNGACIVIT